MHGDEEKFKKIPIVGSYLAKTAKDHIEHHKDVNMNMTINGNTSSNSSLFFSWEICVILIIFSMGSLKIFRFTNKESLIYSVIISIFVCFLWNNWHNDMHDSKMQIDMYEGFPNVPGLISKGPIYKWLWKYHANHHLQKGYKYNYNIIFPCFDYVLGTYKGDTCIDNSDYCNTTSDYRCQINKKFCYTDKDILPRQE
jgi:sterol desaturase/sphingolipid hydroxylase (fatty acid hydroxylase superfamily)